MRWNGLFAGVGAVAVALLGGVAQAQSGVPERVSFTANLNNGSGPVSGQHNFIFTIYDGASSTNVTWGPETWNNLDVMSGMVYAELGATVPLTAAVLNGAAGFLEIKVDGTAMTPRLPIQSVPYAIRAGVANSAERVGGLYANELQKRVGGTCPGSAIAEIDADGGVTCATTGGGGTITGVTPTTGGGLAGGGTNGSVTLGLLTGCSTGQVLKYTSGSPGSWGCANDFDTLAATSNGGLEVTGTAANPTVGLSMAGCSNDTVMTWDGTSWACRAPSVDLASQVTGTLPVANGGTGLSSGPTALGQYLRATGSNVWAAGAIEAADLPDLSGSYVAMSGNQTVAGTKTFSSTIAGDISGNAATVSNGVYSDQTYTDPAWITSIGGGKVSSDIGYKSTGFTGDLTGDVTGGQTSTIVAGIQGRPVGTNVPNDKQCLAWDGPTSKWLPANVVTSVGATANGGLVASGSSSDPTLGLPQTGCTDGKVMKRSGGAWTCLDEVDVHVGDVVAIAVDGGLDLGGSIAYPVITINENAWQKRVTGTCSSASAIASVVSDGTVTCAPFWGRQGNAGTSPATDYVGTSDNTPLELKVNGQKVLRLEPPPAGLLGPNVISGYMGNGVLGGVGGATIGGGGGNGRYEATNYTGSNSVTSHQGTVAGGWANTAGVADGGSVLNGNGASVGGGYRNVAAGEVAVVSGGALNRVWGNGSSIAGGKSNTAFADLAAVGGGSLNQALGDNSSITGGTNNQASGPYAVVAGGQNNIAAGAWSLAGGWSSETAQFGTIAFGYNNSALDYIATAFGGDNNIADKTGATVIGGSANRASGDNSIVAGGVRNGADGGYAAVLGGNLNSARGVASAVIGGYGNQASGPYAVVAGGRYNLASGNNSFASGRYATANFDGCFVWSDSTQTSALSCGAANKFVALASGGVTFYTIADASTGVSVAAGSGAWASVSDRNMKRDFVPVKPAEVLAKVAALPMSTWAYKSEEGARHMGPMAQDFYVAFNLGDSEKTITTIDADGVALAAIQGLNQKTEALEKDNAALKAELDAVNKRLESLEQRRGPIASAPFWLLSLGGLVAAALVIKRLR